MTQERVVSAQAAAAAGPPSLPDLNAETYPFEVVNYLLHQAAHFNLLSTPEPPPCGAALRAADGRLVGVRVRESLQRFVVQVAPGGEGAPLRARNLVGERAGSFEHRWLIVPHDFYALPGREPPATAVDCARAQRFVMLDGVCRLGDGEDGFRGFGTGLTLPSGGGSGRLLAGAVGNVVEGFGRLAGAVGTYTYCGELDLERGFSGNLLLRVMDPSGALSSDGGLPPLEPGRDLEPGITYLVLSGQKRDRTQHTAYRFGPDGLPIGLLVEQDLRLLDIDATARGRLRSSRSTGPVIGHMTAEITFNLLQQGGSGDDPIPFASINRYSFLDRRGGAGGFAADGLEGRTFTLELPGAPGQRALRFGGFGPLFGGEGPYAGISGLMTDNSIVGVSPHALSTSYVLRIEDPDSRYRIAPGAGS